MTNRIYVACLASYNNGVLHGKWIDATTDVDAMQSEVNEVLRTSKFPNVRVAKDEESRERVAQLESMCREGMAHLENAATNSAEEFDHTMWRNAFVEYMELTVPSAEEFAIHDFEGEALQGLGEYCGLQTVAACVELEEIAESELGDEGLAIVRAYWDNVGPMPDDPKEAVDEAREQYCGSFDSWEAWAEEFCDSTGLLDSIPENLRYYFDFEAYGRDARLNGDIFESGGHYFYSR